MTVASTHSGLGDVLSSVREGEDCSTAAVCEGVALLCARVKRLLLEVETPTVAVGRSLAGEGETVRGGEADSAVVRREYGEVMGAAEDAVSGVEGDWVTSGGWREDEDEGPTVSRSAALLSVGLGPLDPLPKPLLPPSLLLLLPGEVVLPSLCSLLLLLLLLPCSCASSDAPPADNVPDSDVVPGEEVPPVVAFSASALSLSVCLLTS